MTFTRYPQQGGGGGGGAVDSVNGQTGTVVLTTTNIPEGTKKYYTDAKVNTLLTAPGPIGSVTPNTGKFTTLEATGNITAANFPITGGADRLAWFNDDGDLVDSALYQFNPTSFYGENFNITVVPTNAGDYQTLHSHYSALNPTVTDADQNWWMHFYEFSAGDDNSGNQVGDASNGSMNGLGMSVRSIQTSNVGNMLPFGSYVNLGNGTDPLTGRNVTMYEAQPALQPGGVTIENLTGYGLGFNGQAASEITNQCLGISISGGLNDVEQFFGVAQGVNFSGTLNSLTGYQNAHSFVGVDSSVNMFTDFNQQNTGTIAQNYFGLTIQPNLNDITGGFFGVNVNPTIDACGNADGLYVNMSNVTSSGTVRAAYFNGDVSIDGALSFTGGLTIGQLSSFSAFTVIDNGGNPSSNNGMVSQLNAAGTVANCDTIGLNTACLIQMDSTFQGTSGGFGIGLASLALPNVVSMEAGCSLDNLTACVYATAFDAANTGGTIDQLVGARSTAIGLGGTQTITRMYSFFADYFAGDVATDSWGFYDNGAKYNWLKNNLKIGGTSGSTDTVTNSSIGLELHDKALRLAVMDTTARNALTAVAGMVIYNTDTTALEYYDGSTWV